MDLGSETQKRRVFLVDDHPLVREWLANLINQQADLQVCGEAGSRAEALALMADARPEIAIVDISLEDSSGIVLIRDIRNNFPKVLVIVLSMHDELLYVERAMRAGARGYVLKREATRNVLEAVRGVTGGRLYVSEEIARKISSKFFEGDPLEKPLSVEQLSNRELEVFELLGRGFTTRQIANQLDVNFKTVQSFQARIKEKFNLPNATELLREATRWHDRKKPD